MARSPEHTAARRRGAMLLSLVGAALALAVSALLGTSFDAPSTVSLAVAAVLLAALARIGEHGAVLVTGPVPTGPSAAAQAPPVPAGRSTDPTHHPLRPRAPGTV